jgi:alkylated DNA nucleotide flippase Atl1
MASSRADEVAEILWELKRADKISTFTLIARRAGFSAGNKGRAMLTTLKTVRRDWPHLHWWRAVADEGFVETESEQLAKLKEAGFEFENVNNNEKVVLVREFDIHIMSWDDVPEASEAVITDVESDADADVVAAS